MLQANFISTYAQEFDAFLQNRVWEGFFLYGKVEHKSYALQQSLPRHKPKFNLKVENTKFKIGKQNKLEKYCDIKPF